MGYKNDNGKALVYDFAMVRLDREVQFTTEISPVCLPSPGRRLDGRKGTVVGWGNEKVTNRWGVVPGLVKGYGYQLSTTLQELDVRFQSSAECERLYDQVKINLFQSNLCAGSDKGDTCTGDSGGGVFIKEGGKYQVVGVVSFGVGCNSTLNGEKLPGVYGRISSVLDWIKEEIRDGNCN